MHCFCCDRQLDSPSLDKPTGRYYCDSCFEPTTEVMLEISRKKNPDYLEMFSPEVLVSLSEIDKEEEEDTEEENLYF